MNKRITQGLISVALGMALVATPATAQVKWQLGLGPTLPMSDFGDSFKLGLNVMAGANLELTAKPISFRVIAAFRMTAPGRTVAERCIGSMDRRRAFRPVD